MSTDEPTGFSIGTALSGLFERAIEAGGNITEAYGQLHAQRILAEGRTENDPPQTAPPQMQTVNQPMQISPVAAGIGAGGLGLLLFALLK